MLNTHRLWQENKSCCQQQVEDKGRLRRRELEIQKPQKTFSGGRGHHTTWAGTRPTYRGRYTRCPEVSCGDPAQSQMMRRLTKGKNRGLLSSKGWATAWQSGIEKGKNCRANSATWQPSNCMPFFTPVWNTCIFVNFKHEECSLCALCELSK